MTNDTAHIQEKLDQLFGSYKAEWLKKDIPFILDFRNCSNSEKNKILDYYDGVIAVLGARQELIEKNIYIFLPKNFEVEIR